MTESYRVMLEAFEGPLDLLLYLIRKAEVDVADIPVAAITEQYVAFLSGEAIERIDIETAGEFLVMAATLMEIKSRMLAAERVGAPAAGAEGVAREAEDPRAELVRQLLEFKKYRDAAESLERRGTEWGRRFGAGAGVDGGALAAAIEGAADVELEDLDLVDLVEAFHRIAETVNFDRLGDHQVRYDDTPIELHAEDIVSRLGVPEAGGELELGEMFRGRTRPEMVGLFLALLELVRSRRVMVRQEATEGRIVVRLREASNEGEAGDPVAG